MNFQSGVRQIHSNSSSSALQDLLQSLFVAELLYPSRCLWCVSPWISDIPVLNNETHSFSQIVPEWQNRRILLSEMIAQMLLAGTTVHIATRDDDKNHSFLSALARLEDRQRLRVHKQAELHEKGLVSDKFYLSGSMNFTFAGIQIYEECVSLITTSELVSAGRITMTQRWGGEVR
jgi:hypothetical protein